MRERARGEGERVKEMAADRRNAENIRKFYSIDTHQYPFVCITFLSNPTSVDDFRMFLCDCKKLYIIENSFKMV